MAQQTAVKKATTVADKPVAASPKPRGKAAKTFDYAKFRQSIRDEKDFAAFLTGYPNKTGILAYIYRLLPAIDNSLANVAESSIYKTSFVEEMNREFIASKFGRGKFMLRLTDANRPKGETDACKTWFLIDDPDLIPIYNPATLKLGDPDNQDEIARLLSTGVLVRDAGTGNPRLRTQADADAPAAAASTANGNGSGDLVSKDIVNTLLMKVINAGSQNPSDTMKQAIDIAKLLQPPNAQPQMSVDQIAELVVAKLERTVTKPNGDGDFFQTYERVEAFIQKVKGPAAIAVPEGTPGWVTVLGSLLERVDRWIPAIVTTMQQRQAPRRAVNGRRPQPGEAEQPQVSVADRITQIATLGFQKMNEGINGFDYAAYVCNYLQGGLEVYQMLEPQGPPGVMGLCAMNTQLAPLMADAAKRAQIESFLSDFFSYDPTGAGGSEVDMSSGAAAA